MLEIEYGRREWLRDSDAAYAEAVRRIRLTRDATDPKDRETIWFSDLGALKAIPPRLGEIEGLIAVEVGDAETPDGGRHISRQAISSLAPLAEATGLRRLNLRATTAKDLSPLRHLSKLQDLDLSSNKSLWGIAPLAACLGLQSLDLTTTQVADIAPLAACVGLRSLVLSGTQVANIAPLATCVSLQSLYFYGTQVADIAPLAACVRLRSLDLSGTQVADIAPLAACVELRSLDLSRTQVADIAPLLRIGRFAGGTAEALNIGETPAAKGDPELGQISRGFPNDQAREVIDWLRGEHLDFDFQQPRPDKRQVTPQQAIMLGSPVTIALRNGTAETVDVPKSGSAARRDPEEFRRRLMVQRRATDVVVRNLEQMPNTPPSLRMALCDYRDSLHEGEAVFEALDILMGLALTDVNSDYVGGSLTEGQCGAVRNLGRLHQTLGEFYHPVGAPPASEAASAPPPDLDRTTPEKTIAQVAEARAAVEEANRAGVAGESVVDIINAVTRLAETLRPAPMESPAQEIERRGAWQRVVRTLSGVVQGFAALAGIHSWATSPPAIALLAKLKPIYDAMLALF